MRLCTPPGTAGVAVLVVAAAERADVAASLWSGARPCRLPAAGGPPRRATLRLDGADVDDVLVVHRADGQLELHVHGAPAVLAALDRRFGVTAAPRRRAAERLLREALSVEQFDLFAEQAALDPAAELAALRAAPAHARAGLVAAARRRTEVAAALATPRRLVLVGRQNAGKSTLFNALLFRERALTGRTPGLTRDPVAELTTLAGYPYELVDTAGEGEVHAAVDDAALAAGRALRAGALQVVVVDASVGPDDVDRALCAHAAAVVASKADLPPVPWPGDVPRDLVLSAVAGGPGEARARLGELLRARRGLPPAGAVGGFAALEEPERAALRALDGDCSGGAPPA